MKKVLYILLCFVLLGLCSCSVPSNPVIKNIAYNKINSDNKSDYTIYLRENNSYVPFLVIDNDYYGNTLLLRKDVLEQPRRISEYTSYYENSEIDAFLNSDYLNYFDENTRSKILDSVLEITNNDSIGCSGTKSTVILRKSFLLSFTEINCSGPNSAPEGKNLKFFKNPDNRIANCNGAKTTWWLRTPNTYYVSCTYSVGCDKDIGIGNSSDANGVRPAFCVDGSTKIVKSSNVVPGEECWTLD